MENQIEREAVYEIEEESDVDPLTFRHVKKQQYLCKVFCWIEQDDTKNVIKFYNTFPHLINELQTPNHWNPLMYAVRYANEELIDFLYRKGMETNVQGIYNQISIVHAAVFSGKLSVLRYVLSMNKVDANPGNCETSPLKIAMKTGNHEMVELLISKGAYYIFGDVINNIELKNVDEVTRYYVLDTKKQVSNSLVVEDNTIKDCPIKQTLRWARIRTAMLCRQYAEKLTEQSKGQTQPESNNFVKEEENSDDYNRMEEEHPQTNQQKELQNAKSEKKDTVDIESGKALAQQQLNESHKFYELSQIVMNDEYYNMILKALVGKGDSILVRKDPDNEKTN